MERQGTVGQLSLENYVINNPLAEVLHTALAFRGGFASRRRMRLHLWALVLLFSRLCMFSRTARRPLKRPSWELRMGGWCPKWMYISLLSLNFTKNHHELMSRLYQCAGVRTLGTYQIRQGCAA